MVNKRVGVIVGIFFFSLMSFSALSVREPRSPQAKAEFKRTHPCPATGKRSGACPGYVIDHIVALACGGPDSPGNMQWQTISEAKEKDRWERQGCQPKSARNPR